MTQMVEFDLAKILERIEQNQTEMKVTLTKLEGNFTALGLQITALQKGQDEIKSELKEVKDDLKATKTEMKTDIEKTKNTVSDLYKLVIVTLVAAIVGASNILLRVFDFLTKG